MDYIYIGDIVNTHGIKGEVRILSNFKYKSMIFKSGFSLYVGNKYEKMIINSYRRHKNFDMVVFDGIFSINDVLKYKGDPVYILRNSISVLYFNDDLIGMSVYSNNQFIGKITSIVNNGIYDILVISNNGVDSMVPNIDEFVIGIDVVNSRVDINVIEGLINEN